MLAEQDGSAVPEHGEVAILVPGVGLGDGHTPLRQLLAREQSRGGLLVDRGKIEAEFIGQAIVQDRDARFLHRRRVDRGEEGRRQT